MFQDSWTDLLHANRSSPFFEKFCFVCICTYKPSENQYQPFNFNRNVQFENDFFFWKYTNY